MRIKLNKNDFVVREHQSPYITETVYFIGNLNSPKLGFLRKDGTVRFSTMDDSLSGYSKPSDAPGFWATEEEANSFLAEWKNKVEGDEVELVLIKQDLENLARPARKIFPSFTEQDALDFYNMYSENNLTMEDFE